MRKTAEQAFRNLGISAENSALLCLDGGGVRGILTIQLLKALEARAGAPCHEIFDMVAGTSTGGIIAGLIASGHSATEIETLYKTFVAKVFTKRDFFANQIFNPPAWSKASYRKILKETLGNVTLEETCRKTGIDLLITSHDVAEGEETFFSFQLKRSDAQNTYRGVLLRAALEATMSAPTYFTPMERFVDGGTTTYNNPALAGVLEAVEYGADQYRAGCLSVFSFGTGCNTQLIAPKDVADPPGPDAKFWLNWIMVESGNDASDMQSDLFRSKLSPVRDYRRFQISLDRAAIAKLPDLPLGGVDATDANKLSELSDKELAAIHLDNVAYFPVMTVIGQAMVAFLQQNASDTGRLMFGYDLVNAGGKELLVTRAGEVATIAKNLSNPDWVDELPA